MSIIIRHARRFVMSTAAALAVVAGLLLAGPATSASAFSSIQAPAGPSCDASTARLLVAAPRVWASSNVPEQVQWYSQIQRWNATTQSWYVYAEYQNWASFTSQGFSYTSWSTLNTIRGGMYVNNYMRYPVFHTGYYRVYSHIVGNQSSLYWAGLVSNGSWCYMS